MAARRKHGFSWSWRRATGVSAAKGRLSRKMGVPLTRAGRQRMIGRKAGCCLALLVTGASVAAFTTAVVWGVSAVAGV